MGRVTGTSIAGAGLGAYSQILSSQGTAAGENYKAASLENSAALGKPASSMPAGYNPNSLSGLY
jgi:hypothetical protein